MAHTTYEDPSDPAEALAAVLAKAVGVSDFSPTEIAQLRGAIKTVRAALLAEQRAEVNTLAEINTTVEGLQRRIEAVIKQVSPIPPTHQRNVSR